MLGVGLPEVVSFGGLVRMTRYLGMGFNIGLVPPIQFSYYGEAKVSFLAFNGYGRIFPFGNAFFFGAGIGYATVSGRVANSFDTKAYVRDIPGLPATIDAQSEGSVSTLVLTPQIGLFHTFGSGFSLGIDVGAQVPLSASAITLKTEVRNVDIQAPPYKQFYDRYAAPAVAESDRKVRETLDKVGRTTLPTVSVRIGWLF